MPVMPHRLRIGIGLPAAALDDTTDHTTYKEGAS